MTGPDFVDLVGDEGTPEELERLRRAHQLLVAAGPPPELSPRLADAPRTASTKRSGLTAGRRKGTAFLLAAGVVAAAFAIGFLVGGRGGDQFQGGGAFAMHAVAAPNTARGSIQVGNRDRVGNWPIQLRVSGLKKLPKGQWYELYLTEHGKITAWCGAFAAAEKGRTVVDMSVPYKLEAGVNWVVTTSERKHPRPIVLTTANV
jgi:hypothetical protein